MTYLISVFLLYTDFETVSGVPGRILTTDYLTFSDPKALSVLAKFNNIELKMFVTENANEGFHTKGYVFKKEEMYRIIKT